MRGGGSRFLIILGMFIILLAGVGLYMYLASPKLLQVSASQQFPPTQRPNVAVVGATIDIEAGTLISDTTSLLEIKNISGDEYAANPQSYFTQLADVRNMKALVKIPGKAPVHRDALGPAGLSLKMPITPPGQPSLKAFPVQVSNLTGVADMIQPGDYVDIMASFNLDVTTFRAGVPQSGQGGGSQPAVVEQASNEGSVKVLLQDAQVFDIVKPMPPQATPEPAPAPPTPAPSPPPQVQAVPPSQQIVHNTAASMLRDGNWVLIIGVTDQEAEVLRFALDRGIGISTLLRRAGDHTTEHTVGSTIRILIDNYNMPVPSSLPPSQHPGPVQVPNVPVLPQEPNGIYAPTITATSGK